MRAAAYAATALVTLALAACGGDEVAVELVWGGAPEPGPGGVVSVDGFASFQDAVDEPWERSPAMAAVEFLRLDKLGGAATTTVEATASGEGTGPQTVVVTLDGIGDDSVRAERWTLAFFEGEDGIYRLDAAIWEQRCQPGRGHQDFGPDDCV